MISEQVKNLLPGIMNSVVLDNARDVMKRVFRNVEPNGMHPHRMYLYIGAYPRENLGRDDRDAFYIFLRDYDKAIDTAKREVIRARIAYREAQS